MACRPARRGASASGSTGSAASVEVSPAGDEITRTGVPPSPGAPIKIWNSSAALSTTATGLPHAALIVQIAQGASSAQQAMELLTLVQYP